MFGKVSDIIKGHLNELTKKEKELSNYRMNICRKCPLFEDVLGGMCSASKCWNETLQEVQSYKTPSNVCGCGCRLKAKTTLIKADCPLKKW